MATTIKDTYGTSLRILRNVLNSWIKTNMRIARDWEQIEDLPWWYNERASLSILAGAVWEQPGGIALEEFVGDKKGHKGKRYAGRHDPYLKIGRQHFIAEAKQGDFSLSRVDKKASQSIQNKLDEAYEDVRKCSPNGQRRLGILFATPYLPESRKEPTDEQIKLWIAMIKTIDCSCSAWVFPKLSRQIVSTSGFIVPGVALLIKEVRG